MRAIGYVRTSIDASLADVRTIDEQRSAIESWARAKHHDLVAITSDVGRTAGPRLGRRAGLADALGMIREQDADAIVVTSLDRLSPDEVEQELIRAELIRRGGRVVSLRRADARALGEHPAAERALIRQVLATAAAFEGTLRDLHVLYRVRGHAAGTEREQAVMARIEELAEQGASAREITLSVDSVLGKRVRSFLARARKHA